MNEIFEIFKDEETQVVQTHISVVFIKRDVVYKVKKPVNFGFLDFSTLDKRKFYCEEEVRLNRRLCPDVYLGVVPVERNGKVIEYAVKMKPLPMDRSLKNLVISGVATEDDVRRVVERIARFHQSAETNERIASFGKTNVFRRNTDENFEQTKDFVGDTIDEATYVFLKESSDEFYRKYGGILDKRAGEGFVKDCHGDLHSEHIVVSERICIFDCIEFNERFRFIDVACDAAFLFMDLDFLGARDLSRLAEEVYRSYFPQEELDLLLPFFKAYRAYVRGKVNSFMSRDELFSSEQRREKADLARKYFDLAQSYMREIPW